MAIENYYKDLFHVDLISHPDGTGGYEYAYKIGEKFKGSVVRASASEQQTAGIRGVVGEQYNITTQKGNELKKDDIIFFINEEGEKIFIRMNISPLHPPASSKQDWKGLTGTRFEPDYMVVE